MLSPSPGLPSSDTVTGTGLYMLPVDLMMSLVQVLAASEECYVPSIASFNMCVENLYGNRNRIRPKDSFRTRVGRSVD